jgi:hypothetical protein
MFQEKEFPKQKKKRRDSSQMRMRRVGTMHALYCHLTGRLSVLLKMMKSTLKYSVFRNNRAERAKVITISRRLCTR